MMKKTIFAIMLLACAAGFSGLYGAANDQKLKPRITRISGKTQKITKLEIVVGDPVPLVRFAAGELQEFLKQATGVKVPVVKKAGGKRLALVLGNTAEFKAAGIDLDQLPEEGYYIIRKGDRVFLAGKDNSSGTPVQNRWQQLYKRGTLSAVYDFLERFAGARFFFGGRHGTVVPARGALYLPETFYIMERPDMSHRNYSPLISVAKKTGGWDGYWQKRGPHAETLSRVRQRFSDSFIQYGHGLNQLHLAKRFAKSNPEYFALMPDGRRCIHPDIKHNGHICYNSKVREVIYQDAKAYLTGKTAASRGLLRWDFHLVGKGFFNIMAQDWLYWCGCEKCRKTGDPGRQGIYYDPKQRQAVSDFIWEFTAEIANRLKKEGITKGGLANMAYTPYDKIPRCDIPDNVRVMVAVNGCGASEKDTRQLKAWAKKTGRRNAVWTYAIGKHGSKNIAGIPPMLHRGLGEFIDANKDYIDGGYFESESDVVFFHYLNIYVLGKKMWNTSLNTEELLDDHYRAMFGKGAPMMKKFYNTLEDCWRKKILGNTIETGLGPITQVPTDHQIWTQIYSAARIKEFNRLFDRALKAVGKDAGAAARLRFVRKHLLGPLAAVAERYHKSQGALDSWRVSCPGTVWLRPYAGEVNEVNTKVTISKDASNLIFTFDCEEPRMADIIANEKKRDSQKIYQDSDVEIFINPSGDRKNYYQFGVNSNGALVDYKCVANDPNKNPGWNSSATAGVVKRSNGWTATVKIPLKDLGKLNPDGVPVNFCRHRALKGKRVREVYYQWSPNSGRRGGFHAIENWGMLTFKPGSEKYLLKSDFSGKLSRCWRSGGEKGGQKYHADKRVFISGGQSAYYKNVRGKNMSAGFQLKGMKPSTRYRLSYFLKTRDLTGKGGAGAYIYFNKHKGTSFPRIRTLGTVPWHRQSFEFVTPADTGVGRTPVLGLWIWQAEGEAWFDNVEVVELGPAKLKKR